MDQDPCLTEATRRPPGHESVLAVSSRRRALDQLRAAALAGPPSPILITGESGAGKTWLTHQLSCILPSTWMSVRIDLTRATDALDFLQLIGHFLGVSLSDSLGAARARLHTFLQDDAADGRHWLLVVDEAHRAAPVVWDEIKAIVNQSGRPGGFAGIVVLGDTELVRTLAARDLRGLASHLATHLHLPPLDLDEARELLAFMGHDLDESDAELEELHRDARGNPRGLLRLAGGWPALHGPSTAISSNRALRTVDPSLSPRTANRSDSRNLGEYELSRSKPPPPTRSTPALVVDARNEAPMLIPTKPPLRVEEGLVEVGWDGDLETEMGETEYAPSGLERASPDDSSFKEELIEDRYAALQAWTEWTKIQDKATGRGGVATEAAPPRVASDTQATRSEPLSAEEPPAPLEPVPASATSGVRAEPQHEFAPYSQLFTRLRQSKQP